MKEKREATSGAGIVTLDKKCAGCRNRITVEVEGPKQNELARAHPGNFLLCHWCIRRLLARAAVARHGDIAGENRRSRDDETHAGRIESHRMAAAIYYREHPDDKEGLVFKEADEAAAE